MGLCIFSGLSLSFFFFFGNVLLFFFLCLVLVLYAFLAGLVGVACACVFARRRMPLMLSRRWAQVSTRHIFGRPLPGLQETGMWNLAYHVPRRTFLVRFHETPNEACYKFFIDDVDFLPADNTGTLCFDLENCFQSPLAELILQSLPIV
ncbi:hypothetical protein TraAM80_07485 [Trypanosoma rangeli]|uniref:Uncharacterized protein n=1 Tax=Trypanosoma rangeli TaxID=5698 RepID=A0A422N568_TRYRA|nr:uncharacterized protein TraAM80_07485 [Trypanosoma rangeli]RNF00581.1 hypothetical protein TraAM80_07485 [Trypanosoma rangeli]|eukprot:RNF00581.1 hypothetical protein TraAM80_07485 [Trypanosoma rangeli]